MTTAITTRDSDAAIMEQVVVVGDLSSMRPEQRVAYYQMVCKSLGLNELTKPFDYIRLNSKLVLYARKDATEQLRKINKVSITQLEKETSEGVYIVTAYAQSGDGRTDSDVGAVSIQGLTGEAKANAMMKAITKAKRRVTLSICGLGFLDETEVDSIPDARPVAVDHVTGEIVEGHVVEQPRPRPAILDTPAPGTPADPRAEYKRLYAKCVNDLGFVPKIEVNKKDGGTKLVEMPVEMPANATVAQVIAMVDHLRPLVKQAEDMQDAA
jgi:hypothetical protein